MKTAQEFFDYYCTALTPFGPCGLTVSDVQKRMDAFAGPYKVQAEYNYHVVAPFVWRKQNLMDQISLAHNRGEKPEIPVY